jgi:myo-inositol-1(or 4)-monophosphatase
MDQVTLSALIEDVGQAASDAAAFIRSEVGKVSSGEIEIKERNSLVSYVDKKAEMILVEALKSLLPDPGFITEEDTVDNSKCDYTWVIDPLDGTTNFLQEIPIFSVSVGLAYHGEFVLGYIVDIMHDDHYYAWKDGGAWLNGKRIHVSSTTDLSEAIVGTGFPYHDPGKLNVLAEMFQEVLIAARGIRRLGSAALDLAYVASGKLDAFYETTLNAWDIAAGVIIVREAGGTVTDFNDEGDFVSRKQLIASNSSLHNDLGTIVRRHLLEV